MKAMLMDIVGNEPNSLMRRSRAREYLQSRILLALQDQGAFKDWAFVGGTALRFLFHLPRYSEDLDFSLMEAGRDVQFLRRLQGVKADLAGEGYDVDLRVREHRNVAGAFVKFRGLLHEIGVSGQRDEGLAVKVEIDANPPAGAGFQTRIIRRFDIVNILHYDKASLFAGKLHAVLSREYTKGRDIYDLAWYLADPEWPEPNFVLLANALAQTGWQGPALTSKTWRQVVADNLQRVDWTKAVRDVSPFLERSKDIALVDPGVLRKLLLEPSR